MRIKNDPSCSRNGYVVTVLKLLPLVIGIPLSMMVFGDFNGDTVSEAFTRSRDMISNSWSFLFVWLTLLLSTAATVRYLHPVLRFLCGCRTREPLTRQDAVKIIHRFNHLHLVAILISTAGFILGETGSLLIHANDTFIGAAKVFLFLNALSKGVLCGVLIAFNLDNVLFSAKRQVLALYPDIPLRKSSLYKKLFMIIGAIVFFLIFQLVSTTAHFFGMGARMFPSNGSELDLNHFFRETIQKRDFKGTFGVFGIKISFYIFCAGELLFQIKKLIIYPFKTIQNRLGSLNSESPEDSKIIEILSNDEFSGTFAEINKLIRRQQSDLASSSDRLDMIVEQAADPILSFTEDGRIHIFNPAACGFFGYTETEAKELFLTGLIELPAGSEADCGNCTAESALIEHLYGHRNGIQRFTGKRKDGSTVMFEGNISRAENSGEVIYTAILRDITAQLEIERNLDHARIAAENANRLKSEFLANMSHELRTPLNAVLGFTQLLSTDKNLTDGQLRKIDIISRSGEHLLSLINDILDLSKIEAGKFELHRSVFSVKQFIGDIQEMFSLRCKKNGLSLYVEFAGELPDYVSGDLGKLRQIMINLVGNAVKFTSEGGIGILVGTDRGRIRFSVTDSGKGIPAGEIELIMQPFIQSSVTDNEGGTGLGLAISSRYIQMMGGELSVESELGKGSTFTFALDLPASETAPRQEDVGPAAVAVKKGSRVTALIVDDKEMNRLVLKEMLEASGFDTIEAENGKVAVEHALEFRPRVVFMDIKMPVMDGYEAVSRIKGDPETAAIPVFALTASAFTNDEEKILASGFDGFLAKPFKKSALFRLIKDKSGIELEYETAPAAPIERAVPDFDSVDYQTASIRLGKETVALIAEAVLINDFTGVQAIAARIEREQPQLAALASLMNHAADGFDETTLARIVARLEKDEA